MITDFCVGDGDVGVDLAGRTDACPALDDHARMDDGVSADFHVGVDVGRGRIDERDPGRHQLFVLVLSHDPAHFREFCAAVNASDFIRVGHHDRFDRQLAPPVDAHQIGQVVLALGVL